MAALTIYTDNQPEAGVSYLDYDEIAVQLQRIGVQFERWNAEHELSDDAEQASVIAAYRPSVDQLMNQYGFQSVDVVSLSPDHPQKNIFREKFLAEHIHEDFEVRFFVDGRGLFYLHVGDKVYAVLCEKGDLISVPANVTHWFDMGENPSFKCIRFFTTPEGWVAMFTGSPIAGAFPTFDQYVAALS